MVLPSLFVMACTGTPPAPEDNLLPEDTASPDGLPSAHVLETMASLFAVRWTQPTEAVARVEFTLDGQWVSTPEQTVTAGEAEVIAAGLPFETEAQWRLLVDEALEAEGTVMTGSPPQGTPAPIVLSSLPDKQAPNLRYLLASVSSNGFDEPVWTVIIDRQGRLVWSHPTPERRVSLHPRLSGDEQSILIDYNSFWGDLDDGVASTVVRIGLDGVIQETIDTPGLHHPFIEQPDGTLFWGAADGNHELLMRRRPGEAAEALWSCADFQDRIGVTAWCRSNTLWLDPDGQQVLFSFFTTETVVEISTETWTETRWFGQLPSTWTFPDPEETFYWQHGVQYTPEGTLLLSARTAPDVNETVIREYALDPEAKTLRQVWSFGLGDGVYGAKMGEPWLLEGGNILHNYGSTPRIREATADGEVVWDIGWTNFQFVGRSTPLAELYSLLP